MMRCRVTQQKYVGNSQHFKSGGHPRWNPTRVLPSPIFHPHPPISPIIQKNLLSQIQGHFVQIIQQNFGTVCLQKFLQRGKNVGKLTMVPTLIGSE